MASRIGTGTEQNVKQGPKLPVWLLAVLGVVVVGAVTAGVIRWQSTDDEAASEPAIVTAAGTADLAPPQTVAPEPPVVYIVATQEAADQQSRALAEADEIRNAMGLPPLTYTVFVAETPEMADGVIRATEDANQMRAYEGLPIYRLVDLRR